MRLLAKLRAKRSRKKETKAVTHESVPLEFDFGKPSLCGIRLGDAAPLLWRLGPPEDSRKLKQGIYCFYTRGFEVRVKHGLVVSFGLFWNRKLRPPYKPFAGHSRLGEKALTIKSHLPEHQLLKCFGDPYWRSQSDEQVLLFYEFKKVEWLVEINRGEGLSAILIHTPALLADRKQRAIYRVTKPWPPEIPGPEVKPSDRAQTL